GEPLYFEEIIKDLNILNGKFKLDVNVTFSSKSSTYIVFKKRYTANGEPLYFEEIIKDLNILNGKFKLDVNV
ncbi:hypothetical protein ACT453_61785, partial [Bacillus sp. D-CC]